MGLHTGRACRKKPAASARAREEDATVAVYRAGRPCCKRVISFGSGKGPLAYARKVFAGRWLWAASSWEMVPFCIIKMHSRAARPVTIRATIAYSIQMRLPNITAIKEPVLVGLMGRCAFPRFHPEAPNFVLYPRPIAPATSLAVHPCRSLLSRIMSAGDESSLTNPTGG